MRFWLKACPKCGGDLKLQPDLTGAYVACVQCGLELDPVQERLLRRLGHVSVGQPAPVAPRSPHHRVA